LDLQRRVAADAPTWLRPRGRLLIETSERQAPATVAAFEANGFAASILRSEELDGTVVVGTLLD
jgi:release factor glutamine methyltransferase